MDLRVNDFHWIIYLNVSFILIESCHYIILYVDLNRAKYSVVKELKYWFRYYKSIFLSKNKLADLSEAWINIWEYKYY